MGDERDKIIPNVPSIPHHDGNRKIVLTEHSVDPFFIRNEHGGLTRITQILVPEESTVQHRHEENTLNEQTFELVPADEPDIQDNLPNKNEDNQVRSIIEQLGDSKRAQFLNVTGKPYSILFAKLVKNLIENQNFVQLRLSKL